MIIKVLGTGTSQGVPVVGCHCEVCESSDTSDKRLRSSILVSSKSTNVVIDVGPDFRQQMLRAKQESLDAVILTHEHNDHVIGLDDVRPFNFKQKKNMAIYGTRHVLNEVKSRFAYAFTENPYPGAPRFELIEIDKDSIIEIGDIRFEAVQVMHGRLPVLGFRIGRFAYLTDVKTIDPEEREKLNKLDCLIINALHHRHHKTHLNLEEAIQLVQELKPARAYFTHISHSMGLTRKIQPSLPVGISLAFDQQVLEFPA